MGVSLSRHVYDAALVALMGRSYTGGMPRLPKIFVFLIAIVAGGVAQARDCPADHTPALVAAQFTSAVRSQQPQDQLLYLPSASREVFIHATTRGAGKITYRWFRDGKRVTDVGAKVGDGEWHTWSRLRLPPPVPNDVRVHILGNNGCLLRDMTLVATALVENPGISKAWQQIAAGDATGAKITLKILLEETPARTPLARAAQRMLDIDVTVAQAMERATGDELFLVESTLKSVEKKLGNNAADRAVRTRIADVRTAAAKRRKALLSDGNLMALATRHLLETQKIFYGDYPLWRADAEKVVTPALLHAGDTYAFLDWKPTLRGYKLVLQDKRSGDAVEVTPD